MRKNTTGMAVMGLGALVSKLGKVLGGKIGAAILGFGLAHVVLGFLDRFRPTVRFK